MKVVVTGGSGQLGTLVLRRLIALRRVERIVSLDLEPPVQRELPGPQEARS